MTGERSWVAPELTPAVDVPEVDSPAETRRGVVDTDAGVDEPAPGEVPGLGTRVEGRSQLGTTTGADRTDEGGGNERGDDPI